MSGDKQERFEDYQELEQFLADLQTGKSASLPQDLTPTQARLYRVARLFHAALPEVSEPRPEFAARLEEELQARQKGRRPPRSSSPNKNVTRRRLLAGGAVAAASVAVGVGSEWLVEQATQKDHLQRAGTPMEWLFVTTVARLGTQAVSFVTADLIGYVVRSDGTGGDPADRGQILALSAACPHQGCLVQWTGATRTFRCPCHEAVFTQDGETDARASAWRSLKPLPRLEVKIETDGKIYVRMPK